MIESGYYPAGAEFDKDAPYNQFEPDLREFDVDVVVSFSISAPVHSIDYTAEKDFDEDDEGHCFEVVEYSYDGSPVLDFTGEYMSLADAIGQVMPLIKDDPKYEKVIKTFDLYANAECEYENG